MAEIMTVFVTVGNPDDGLALSRALVEEKLVACVNMISQVRSIYWWKEEVCEEQEVLLVMKTPASLYDSLQSRIRQLHPYEVPEIVALPIVKGLPDYLNWVVDSTSQR